MALILIIIIMMVGLGIVGSVFSSINPFIDKLGTINNYSAAYYGAIMSVERGLLALRYHDAGFEGTSGLLTGNTADNLLNHQFGRYTTDPSANMYWTITSRTINSIPGSGAGNIEALFATGDSIHYNSLAYYEGLDIPLSLDNTTLASNFYSNPSPSDIDNINAGGTLSIEGRFRLPPRIKAGLGDYELFDIGDVNADIDEDTIRDDIIVNRGLKGIDTLGNSNFTIIPSISQDFSLFKPRYEYDNAIRESIINEGDSADNIDTLAVNPNSYGFHFGIPGDSENSLLTGNNILPLSSALIYSGFTDILNDTSVTGLVLSFNIINRMRTSMGNIYPFLEWQLKFCDGGSCNSGIIIPDRFYNILGVGNIGGYSVQINIKKPVRESSNTSNFTIIF